MSAAEPPPMRDVVRRSYFATHAGRSTDDVVIDDTLNAAFLEACLVEIPSASAFELNRELYNLRKHPPGLGKVATVKRRDNHDAYLHAAEIAARNLEDRHGLTIDAVLCDPQRRCEFDTLAKSIA